MLVYQHSSELHNFYQIVDKFYREEHPYRLTTVPHQLSSSVDGNTKVYMAFDNQKMPYLLK